MGGVPRYAALALLGLAVCASCAPTSPRQRTDVAAALVQRTGHSIGETARGELEIAPGVSLDDGLTSQEAVALALWNNGDLQIALTQLGFAKADLIEAGTIPNPTFSMFFPVGPKQLEAALFQSLSFLWKRPKAVKMASLNVERIAEVLVQQGLDTARDARLAHAEVVRAQERLELGEQAAATWDEIVRLNEIRVRVGASNELALAAVLVDARIAQVDAGRLRHDVDVATAQLRRIVGLPERSNDPQVIADSLPHATPKLEELLALASAARPDLRAAELAIEAAGARAGLEKAQIVDLVVALDANGQGTQGFEIGPGAAVQIPIFNQNQAGRARAEVELEKASWTYMATLQRIAADVRTAHARFAQAQEALEDWPKRVVKPAEDSERLAKRAYELGGASYLNVLDSTRRLVAARERQAELESELRRAWAELARSVGRDFDEDH